MRYCQVNCVRAAGSRQVALCSSRVSFRVIFIKCIIKWIKCCVVLCHAVLCHAVQCCAVLCHAVLCHAVQCCVVLCHAVLCCAMPCCAVLCCAVLCHAVQCCVVLCCAWYERHWVSICSSVLRQSVEGRHSPVSTAAGYQPRTEWKGAARKPYRYNQNSVGWTFSGWGPIRRRMGWVLAANQVGHSTDTSLSWRQPGPRLHMIITRRARQLCIWCGSRHDLGLSLRSSWQPCGCEFFLLSL